MPCCSPPEYSVMDRLRGYSRPDGTTPSGGANPLVPLPRDGGAAPRLACRSAGAAPSARERPFVCAVPSGPRTVPDIQAVIRKHRLGATMTLLLVRGGEPRELVI